MTLDPVDALLVVSFGGPEGPEDVMPFLEQVLHGRNVPRDRLEAVAEHYRLFGGISPINAQNRSLVEAIRVDLSTHGLMIPVYWGNRNWHPFLGDTVARMADDGVRRAAAFVTSAYGSWSGCRQYRDDIERARATVGQQAPVIDKLRLFFDHPGFIEPFGDALAAARLEAGPDAPVLFSAHSIPQSMAATSGYVAQLTETARLVAGCSGPPAPSWQIVFQSRSGPPSQPWLEPDVVDVINDLAGRADASRPEAVVIAPIGFVSDHMEVVYDLDTEAAAAARHAGITLVRAATPGTHPLFVTMIRELLAEIGGGVEAAGAPRRLSALLPGDCGVGCCPPMLR